MHDLILVISNQENQQQVHQLNQPLTKNQIYQF